MTTLTVATVCTVYLNYCKRFKFKAKHFLQGPIYGTSVNLYYRFKINSLVSVACEQVAVYCF